MHLKCQIPASSLPATAAQLARTEVRCPPAAPHRAGPAWPPPTFCPPPPAPGTAPARRSPAAGSRAAPCSRPPGRAGPGLAAGLRRGRQAGLGRSRLGGPGGAALARARQRRPPCAPRGRSRGQRGGRGLAGSSGRCGRAPPAPSGRLLAEPRGGRAAVPAGSCLRGRKRHFSARSRSAGGPGDGGRPAGARAELACPTVAQLIGLPGGPGGLLRLRPAALGDSCLPQRGDGPDPRAAGGPPHPRPRSRSRSRGTGHGARGTPRGSARGGRRGKPAVRSRRKLTNGLRPAGWGPLFTLNWLTYGRFATASTRRGPFPCVKPADADAPLAILAALSTYGGSRSLFGVSVGLMFVRLHDTAAG